jgi:ParB-like chromosome segregation protein Spo0J
MRIGLYDTHPAADAYPLLQRADLANFTASIKADGQREAIVLLAVTPDQTLILDGRNRYIALLSLGIEPRFRYFDEVTEGDPIAFVKSMNNDRRHQEIVSRVLSLQRLQVIDRRERKRDTQDWLPDVSKTEASMLAQINEDAEPEVLAAVHAGELDASKAAALSQLEPEQQREGIERIRAAREEEEKPEPVRARKAHEGIAYEAGELSPTDIAALVTLCRIGEKSVHAEAGHGASVLRRMVPGLGKR